MDHIVREHIAFYEYHAKRLKGDLRRKNCRDQARTANKLQGVRRIILAMQAYPFKVDAKAEG